MILNQSLVEKLLNDLETLTFFNKKITVEVAT